MNLEEEERVLRERRKVLHDIAMEQLLQAAKRVEEFGYTVVCHVTPKK